MCCKRSGNGTVGHPLQPTATLPDPPEACTSPATPPRVPASNSSSGLPEGSPGTRHSAGTSPIPRTKPAAPTSRRSGSPSTRSCKVRVGAFREALPEGAPRRRSPRNSSGCWSSAGSRTRSRRRRPATGRLPPASRRPPGRSAGRTPEIRVSARSTAALYCASP